MSKPDGDEMSPQLRESIAPKDSRMYDLAATLFHSGNAFLGLIGLAIFVCGFTYLSRFVQFKRDYPPINAEIAVFEVSILGGLIFCLACMGVVAAILSQDCLQGGYVISLLPINGVQIYFGVAFSKWLADLKEQLSGIVRSHWDTRNADPHFWDDTQRHWNCCGLTTPLDWISYGHQRVPTSCCDILQSECDTFTAWQIGCETAFLQFTQCTVWMMTLSYFSIFLSVFCIVMLMLMRW